MKSALTAAAVTLMGALTGALPAQAQDAIARIPAADAEPGPAKDRLDARRAQGARVLNIHRIAAWAPEVTRGWGQLSQDVRQSGLLPRRYRELAIMRVAHLTGSAYEWEQHRGYFLEQGFDAAQMAAVRRGATSPLFDAKEKAVLAFTDQSVRRHGQVDDKTFAAVHAGFSPQEMVELTATIGTYIFTALVANTYAVKMEN